METSTIVQPPFPPRFDSMDATSLRPVAATPPDPDSIPIAPPKGSPRPPTGQLLPDVAAAEDPSSPNKLQTPPPSTPSPPTLTHGETINSEVALDTPQNMHPEASIAAFGRPDTPIEPSPLPPAISQVQEAAPVESKPMIPIPAPGPAFGSPSTFEQEQAPISAPQPAPAIEDKHEPAPAPIPAPQTAPVAQDPTLVAAPISATPPPQSLQQQPMDLASPPNPIFHQTEPYKSETDGDVVMGESHHFGQDATMLGNGDFGHELYPDLDAHTGFDDVANQYSSLPLDHDDHIDGPPMKRQKLDSPAPGNLSEDMMSAGLQLESPVAPVAPWARPMTQPQNKFALSIVRTLRKSKDAIPFLVPVDPVALNIPHYPQIITNPMDLSTVEKKLGGAKMDTAQYARYANVDEFVADIKLIIENCAKFNGPEHPVTQMALRMEEQFDKLMKNMPTADEVKPPAKPIARKPAPARRPSTAGGGFPRRDDSYVIARPKREVPPPREQYPVAPNRPVVKKRFPKRDDGTLEQLRFCTKLINDLYRPKYSSFAYPFYEPVDYIKLEIPHYPKVIKKPMDMATMSSKLSNHEYPNATAFYNDFKLMIKNCFAFNPAGTPVHQAGVELNAVFDEKWQGLPNPYGDSDDGAEEDESDAERSNAVMMMEAQIQSLHSALEQLKKPKKEKKPKNMGMPSMPKPPKAPSNKPPGAGGFKKKKKPTEDEDTLSFEQKKQLSETIQTLDGNRLEKVLEIIDEVYPEIRETSEEIELDIDSLPSHVLNRLYNFVIRPNKPRVGRPPNGSSSSKALGVVGQVAGTKRKSMNEEEESEKIRQLEATLQRLKNGQATAEDVMTASQMNGMTTGGGGDESGSESDSSDSSGSDSE